MNQVVVAMPNQFDLATLDKFLGTGGLVSAIENHPSGLVRYAAISKDISRDQSRVTITANLALSSPGRGRRLYKLLTLDLQIRNGVATIVHTRCLGRLTSSNLVSKDLIALAESLTKGTMPNRAQLATFMPSQLLDELENTSPKNLPEEGVDHEYRLPKEFWEKPNLLLNGQVDSTALSVTLNIAEDEQVELANVDPKTGEYRVFHVSITPTPTGGQKLSFELHRQQPSGHNHIFNVLSLTLSPTNAHGMCSIESFSCNAGAIPADLTSLLPQLAIVVTILRERKKPENALIFPFLSRHAQALWTEYLPEGIAS